MKILNKILTLSIILWFSISIATATDDSDCWRLVTFQNSESSNNWFRAVENAREIDKFFLSKEQQKDIITKDDLNVAMLNLKIYCCKNGLWWLDSSSCTGDNSFYNRNVVDSKYLFDHLFDVVMRRLNGLTWETNIYPNMTTDTSWELPWTKRRSFVVKEAENLSWSNPQKIIDEYNKYRTPSKKNLWYDIASNVNNKFSSNYQTFIDYISWSWNSKDSTQVANALKNYKNRTLYDRYNNACALTEIFYMLLNWANGSSTDKSNTIIARNQCEKIIKDQIKSENDYVSLITKKSSDLFLSNYIKSYTSYLYSREDQLKKTRKDSTDRFLDVVRAVPHLVKTCNR